MMRTFSESTTVLAELAVLLRLTRTEAQIARARISQARSEEIRRELAEKARQAETRAGRIQTAIRRLGGALLLGLLMAFIAYGRMVLKPIV